MIKWLHVMIQITVFVMVQALVIDNMRLFGIMTPFIYLYALLKFPFDMSRSAVILLSFFLGLIIDGFSNTFGMHAAACSFIGFIRTPLLGQFADIKELPDRGIPSYRLLGFSKFFYYTLILVTLHHIILFSIDSFGFYQPMQLTVRISSSILLTSLLVFIIEAFNLRRVKYGE